MDPLELNLATKASGHATEKLPKEQDAEARVDCTTPALTGKSVEFVKPVTYTFPDASRAIAVAALFALPPR
jgi:hypothetical protein